MNRLYPIFRVFFMVFAFWATAPAQPITTQPQSITVNNASSATFTVGAGSVTGYQWQFNTTNLMDGISSNGVTISGSTNSVLTLEDVTTNEAGSYTVIVSNLINSVTSSNAVLTITNGTTVRFILSGFPGAGTSNVDVQLFDHDKPATVANFIHYIRSGAYANMFFDRCYPGFVLQGGDYATTDQTNTNAPMTGWDIRSYTASNQFSPPFPPQVENEFGFGPLIHNRFGTIAMALGSSSNSATSAFFFNLADNSGSPQYLDDTNFTVFGRILNNSNEVVSSNVLAYFNALNYGNGAVESSTFLDYGTHIAIPYEGVLPVDYAGTSAPADSNLAFCGFDFLTTPPLDTNAPTVSITSPASPMPVTNLQGTASDDTGLAVVICVLTPQAATDGTYPYPYTNAAPVTNYAVGTANWSLGLYPGSYDVSVQSQNGAGYLSAPATNQSIVTAIVTNGNGTIIVTNVDGVTTNINAVGYPLRQGSTYYVEATPGSNQFFVSWTAEGYTIVSPDVPFNMQNGFVLTATFVSNGIPDSLAIAYPPSNAIIGTNAFNLSGTISNAPSTPLAITCFIYSRTEHVPAGNSPLTTSGSTNWSVAVSNLPPDSYAVEVMAMDSNGNQTMSSEYFTVATNVPLVVDVIGPGRALGVASGQVFLVGSSFQATAVPDANQFFYTWMYGTEVSLNPVQSFTMAGASTLTATFVSNTLPPNSIAFTSPAANVVLSNYTLNVGGTISSNGVSPPLTVTCQLFSQTNGLAVLPAQSTIGTTNWSLTMSELPAGNYIALVKAVDQASRSTVILANFRAIVDNNAPGLSILYPGTNSILSDNIPLVLSGTASDTNGLARLYCSMTPLANEDGTVPNQGITLGGYSVGTTNWSLNFGVMPPGVYSNYVAVLDNVGNVSRFAQLVTNTGILVNGDGSVSLTQAGVVKTSPIGYPLQDQAAYKIVATPAAGSKFIGWSAGAYTTTNPAISFTNAQGLLWTATFVRSSIGKGISFTYPSANARLTTNKFLLEPV
jgi:cyclophilin family peptidyl-prolyl cis-trans isomerase